MNDIRIPRQLADQLLRHANQAGDLPLRGEVIRDPAGFHCLIGETGALPFAYWESHPQHAPEPGAQVPQTADGLLFFGITLEIDGVLQLRIWEYLEGAWTEMPVEIYEN